MSSRISLLRVQILFRHKRDTT